jgi:type IV secretory pathway VirB10-like protein
MPARLSHPESRAQAPVSSPLRARRIFAALPLVAAAVALVLSSLLPAQAQQWTWRDRNGQINASDRPPPRDIPEKDILSRPNPEAQRRAAPPPPAPASAAAPGAAPARGPLDREVDARKRAAEQEQAAKARAEEERLAQQRAENCRRARSHLAALDSGQRIARVNDKGEREVLDDRGRADEVRQAREVIASDCR